MPLSIDKFIKKLLNLPRYVKRIIVIFADFNLCFLSTWFAFYLRLEDFNLFTYVPLNASLFSVLLALPVFWILGVYRVIFRFAGSSIIFTVFVATFAYSLLYFVVIGIYVIQDIPRSIGIIQPILLFLSISASRITIKFLFSINFKKLKNKTNV